MKTKCSPFVVGLLALGTFLPAIRLHAQGNSGRPTRPSYAHGDVLRGVPRNGAPPGGAVVTGNGINYNGGPVMHNSPVNLYYILYGSTWPAAAPTILENWAAQIGGTPYFNINTTYGDTVGNVPNAVSFVGTYTDSGTLGNSLNDSSIGTLTSNAINHGFTGAPVPAGTADPNGLYMVLTAPGVAETTGFLTSYCGWHWSGSFVSGAVQEGTIYSGYPVVKFAFIGDAAGPSFGSCAIQSTSPNGDAGADAMISVMAHELSETVSDPQGNAWYASNGEENGDLCAWNFGTAYAAPNGSSANVNINGTDYLMQQIWVNALGGKCVLSYAAAPDFSLSASPSSINVTQGGAGVGSTVTVTSLNGFDTAVSLSVTACPTNATCVLTSNSVTPPANGSNSTTLTVTAALNTPTGTTTVTISGTGSSGTHTTGVSVTVQPPPNYSLSASPSSLTIQQGQGKNSTITVQSIGGYNSAVGLTVSGCPSFTTCLLSPTSVTPPANGSKTSTLTITTTSNTALGGPYKITISGDATHSTTVSLTVTAPADFGISVLPTSITIKRGSSGSVTVSTTQTGGASTVSLSIFGLPSKVTASFSSSSVAAGSNSTLKITVNKRASATPPGVPATLTITGNNGANSHSTTLSLTIN